MSKGDLCRHGRPRDGEHPSRRCLDCAAAWCSWKASTTYPHVSVDERRAIGRRAAVEMRARARRP